MYNKEITVILNGWKRPYTLEEQIRSVENQTIKPKEIMLWQNTSINFDPNITNQVTTAISNKNFGVWARFAFALNANTEYICVFDDDTIPGDKWFENCLDTISTHEGLLGTVGLIFQNEKGYRPHIRIGWPNPNLETVKVDIVGHAWFFKREWLSAFWKELPEPLGLKLSGEDMHFSFMIQKYLALNTYVPPHPLEDTRKWGSLKALEYGINDSLSYEHGENIFNEFYLKIIFEGFKIIKRRKIYA